MGIDGLLRHLKQCNQERNLEEYRGKKAAVDTYAWLHKIIKGTCGLEIIQGRNKTKYISDCLRRVEKISNAGIELILVFDGGVLPKKQNQQQVRKKKREENYEKGCDLMRAGQRELGQKKMIDSIDVSPDIAYKLIQELKKHNYQYIVAPYEADAQLAYLSRTGLVDVIITEDSDLLAFGAKRILYKLDFTTLNGYEICLDQIKNYSSTGFSYFTHGMFLTTCVMAGCDYLPQIKGVGIKLAQKVISRNHTLKKSLIELAVNKTIPDNYEDNFLKALLTFRFQRVYCPKRKRCVEVNELQPEEWKNPENLLIDKEKWSQEFLDITILEKIKQLNPDPNHSDWDFLGKKLSDQMAVKVAEGQLNPISFNNYDDECLNKLQYKNNYLFPEKAKPSKIKTHQPDPSQKSIQMFLKSSNQRKVSYDYRNFRNRSLKEDYIMVNQEQDGKKISMFPASRQNQNKRKLRFREQESDQSDDDNSEFNLKSSEMISQDSESMGAKKGLKSENLVCNHVLKNNNLEKNNIFNKKKSNSVAFQKAKSTLQELCTMFDPLFTEEFLKAPFESS